MNGTLCIDCGLYSHDGDCKPIVRTEMQLSFYYGAEAMRAAIINAIVKDQAWVDTARIKAIALPAFSRAGIAVLEPQASGRSEPVHAYTSTACQHGLHDQCRLKCKYCEARCNCSCGHAGGSEPERITMAELVKIWTDMAMSEDAQRFSSGTKDWSIERAIGIRAVLAAAKGKEVVE